MPSLYSTALKFLSTPSARRATLRRCLLPCRRHISIHALREEGDSSITFSRSSSFIFLSTPSARRATNAGDRHLPRHDISIHALREEGDLPHHLGVCFMDCISIHALREEGDAVCTTTYPASSFLSTPSARRATAPILTLETFLRHFYPRPPRGGRPETTSFFVKLFGISIHALREEGDLPSLRCLTGTRNFYPRPPRGGRPFGYDLRRDLLEISIHALREEGDDV